MLEMCQCIIQCFYLFEGTHVALSNEHFMSNSIIKIYIRFSNFSPHIPTPLLNNSVISVIV